MIRDRFGPWVGPAVLLLTAVVFAATQSSTYRLQLGTLAGIYAIAAIGLSLLFGGAGQISLGQAGFVGIGAFVTAALTVDHGLPVPVAAAAGMAACLVVGLLLGWSALRLTGHYLALVTLAFGLVFVELMRTVLPEGYYAVPLLQVAGVDLSGPRALFLSVWGVAWCAYLGVGLLLRSRFGRALAAMRDDPLAAASCSIDLARTKLVVFAIAAVLGGLSGSLFAVYQGSVTETPFGFVLSVNLLIMVVIGGLGSPSGAVLGAVFLTLVPELGRDYERYRLFAYGVLLVAAVALLPGGLASIGRGLADRIGARLPGRALGPRPVTPEVAPP